MAVLFFSLRYVIGGVKREGRLTGWKVSLLVDGLIWLSLRGGCFLLAVHISGMIFG